MALLSNVLVEYRYNAAKKEEITEWLRGLREKHESEFNLAFHGSRRVFDDFDPEKSEYGIGPHLSEDVLLSANFTYHWTTSNILYPLKPVLARYKDAGKKAGWLYAVGIPKKLNIVDFGTDIGEWEPIKLMALVVERHSDILTDEAKELLRPYPKDVLAKVLSIALTATNYATARKFLMWPQGRIRRDLLAALKMSGVDALRYKNRFEGRGLKNRMSMIVLPHAVDSIQVLDRIKIDPGDVFNDLGLPQKSIE